MELFDDCVESLLLLLWKIAFERIDLPEYASCDSGFYLAGTFGIQMELTALVRFDTYAARDAGRTEGADNIREENRKRAFAC